MKITPKFVLVSLSLYLCSANISAVAQEWIEFQPPMMDDVTVDPLRFTQQGIPFDLSNPAFTPIEHGQSAMASRSDRTTKEKLIVDYEFTGRAGLEYLEIKTNFKIEKPGFNIGGVFSTDLPKAGAIRIRLRDPSGEIHQHTLGYPTGTSIFTKIETTSEDAIWGGDGDKQLQFPCEIVSILLDRPEPTFKGKGTLEITNLTLYEAVELRDAVKIEFAASSPPGLLFENKGTLRFRLAPKDIKRNERLLCRFEFRDALAGSWTQNKVEMVFCDLNNSRWNGKPAATSLLSSPMVIPANGLIVEIPVVAPGAARIVIFATISSDSGNSNAALPVSFSFGSIRPNAPQDDRFGVCTHYQQGWNANSMDFAVKAGFGMIRDEMNWGNVERQKGVLAVPNYATYVDLALKKNLDNLLILNYSNRFYDNNNFPTSDEAVAGFANYSRFLAEQFKGRVRYFEVWNEWTGGCGMRHVPKTANTPENYVKLLKATYEAVKTANPEACIVGGGGDHPLHERKQIEAMFEAGALKYCDAFSIHPYRQPRTPEESDLIEEVLSIAGLMKKHGVEEPKLWITEIGWPTPKKHPAKDAELFQAAMVVRSAVPLISTGAVEKYFWYDLKNDGLDRIDQEHNFGILRHDRLGLQVKPAFVAFAVMSANTAGRKITKDASLSQDGAYAYRLTKTGEPDRLVLWVEHGEKMVRLPEISSATNLFGTALATPSSTVTLTNEPVWIELRKTIHNTSISTENQQIIKGLGGGLPWPQAGSGFPIINHPDGMEILLDMGISIARIYWHNQFNVFDQNGDPTDRGMVLINGIVAEVRWLNENKIPYNMDGGINNLPYSCYFNDPETGHLLPEYEPAQVKTMLHVLNAIRDAGLKLPLMVVPFNEPSAPVVSSNNRNPTTGAMKREQCVRIAKLLRAELNKAGYKDILLGYSENGQPMYANFYAGNDIGGRANAYGGIFVDVANGEKLWSFFNPALSRYDAELNAAVGAFTTHSYYPGNRDIHDYIEGYLATGKGRDNWMTEYCLWGGKYNEIHPNYNQELLRKFISDIVFFHFNYWEFWNIWNISTPAPCTDILCGGSDRQNRKPAAYYALRKIFRNIAPGKTYVRRITTDIPGLVVDNATAMNAVAFVSPDKTVAVLVNSSAACFSTNIKGLYGKSAEVFQIDGANNNLFNTDMTLVDAPTITQGTINKIDLPPGTITVVVTDGGEAFNTSFD